MINPEQLASRFPGKVIVDPVPPIQDLYEPGKGKPSSQGQIPQGRPIPADQFVQQTVGRGMAVVPPQERQSNQPQMAVIPPQATSRTSLGTLVEPPPVVAPSPSNPLSIRPPANEIKAEPPKRKPLDLAKEILTHIWELGGEKSEEAQKFYERSHDTLHNWLRNPAIIPLAAINKFLQRAPGIRDILMEELEVHFQADQTSITSLPNRGKLNMLICTPVLERMTPPYATMLGVLCKQYELGFTFEGDTMLPRGRNQLAKRFLESGCTWSLWIDSDIAAPIGKPEWFKNLLSSTQIPEEYLGYEVCSRFLNHNKAVIGGVYASRRWRGKIVIQPEIKPRSHEDKLLCNDIRKGTARGLVDVDWIGFGCAMVHRQVFLEIQRRFPDLAPREEFGAWRFFQTEGDEGEDEAFCRRVKACGISIWLDTQLICGHIGNHCFLPEHTQALMAQ